jgi:phage terminase small subunit
MLTANQEQFVQNIIQGMSQADAYRLAYPKQKMADKTLHEAASRLMGNSKVLARLKELRDKLAKPSIMSAQERLQWLTERIADDEVDINAKLKAIDIMNKMQGEYVQKVEAEVKNAVNINIELSDD